MQFQITSDNMEVTPSMQELAKSKFTKLQKKFAETPEDLVMARIVMNKSGADEMFKVKINFSASGEEYFGEGRDYNMESALIDAVDDIQTQVNKSRSKEESKNWEKQREMKRYEYEDEDTEDSVYDDFDSKDSNT